jgi:hypothetical protein
MMARIRVTFDGSTSSNGSPLLMHNERLADPLDPYAKSLAELSKKRAKTERELEEMARREFVGGGYWADDRGPEGGQSDPYIPTWNILRCLQEAATRYKLGKHVVSGIVPVEEMTPLRYDGPRDADALWKSGLFHSRKGVSVGQSKVIRTRPCFTDWKVVAELELDLTILDPDTVNLIAEGAGMYKGLGDNRPRFGRFAGSSLLLEDAAQFIAPDVLDKVRSELAVKTGIAQIRGLDASHAESHPNGNARAKRAAKAGA